MDFTISQDHTRGKEEVERSILQVGVRAGGPSELSTPSELSPEITTEYYHPSTSPFPVPAELPPHVRQQRERQQFVHEQHQRLQQEQSQLQPQTQQSPIGKPPRGPGYEFQHVSQPETRRPAPVGYFSRQDFPPRRDHRPTSQSSNSAQQQAQAQAQAQTAHAQQQQQAQEQQHPQNLQQAQQRNSAMKPQQAHAPQMSPARHLAMLRRQQQQQQEAQMKQWQNFAQKNDIEGSGMIRTDNRQHIHGLAADFSPPRRQARIPTPSVLTQVQPLQQRNRPRNQKKMVQPVRSWTTSPTFPWNQITMAVSPTVSPTKLYERRGKGVKSYQLGPKLKEPQSIDDNNSSNRDIPLLSMPNTPVIAAIGEYQQPSNGTELLFYMLNTFMKS
ncbi:hypothetical protein DM02DRAFT_315330 [Periconia macrospinosa]|uniref:Uncharacterized protein n=1 Tax=Periconia macrospinosa TaxID=97972 RepID=A0A2V1DUU9_9PLEO|nr:hypothetical protein DM02DRAFT_315330 [Periconia macrospinosa]